ncbi:beta-propeller fold lactonase family protein [Listeria monocytogenes]|uniref:beta-propeller fold lactonase family protein n=1 Tax=Listeria monocytogenes TaxID=1639 RepID=UPI000A5914D9
MDNPTYLKISDDEKFVYSVAKDGDKGGVAAFSVGRKTVRLLSINQDVQTGNPPCYVDAIL